MIGGGLSTICERGSRLQDHNPLEQIRRRIEAGDPSWAIERLRSLISKGVAAPDVHRLLALAYLTHSMRPSLRWRMQGASTRRRQPSSDSAAFSTGRVTRRLRRFYAFDDPNVNVVIARRRGVARVRASVSCDPGSLVHNLPVCSSARML
jgi:hypothetical protein